MRLPWERKPQSPEAEQPKRVTFAVLGDTHGGHKLGLLNPDVKLYDEAPDGALVEYTPQPTAAQVELWQLHIHHLDQLHPRPVSAGPVGQELPDGRVQVHLGRRPRLAPSKNHRSARRRPGG